MIINYQNKYYQINKGNCQNYIYQSLINFLNLIQTMLQQPPSSFEITRNEQKEAHPNRIKAYFESSSFRAQQQELALFIKNFPIIKLDDLGSLNKLVELLIKQNQLLGNKCQQNVVAVRDMFSKHEQLLKNNKNLHRQINDLKFRNNQVRNKDGEKEALQTSIKKMQADLKIELDKKDALILNLQQAKKQIEAQNAFYHQSIKHLGGILQQIYEKNYKKAVQLAKQISNKSSLSWIDWNQLEKYLKTQKKKAKYIPKIRQTVQSFCSRLVKICEYVPVSQIREQSSREIQKMMEMLDDMLQIKKRAQMGQSRNSQYYAQSTFFDGLLQRIARDTSQQTVNKQDLANQLHQVKLELSESKKYYEQYLVRLKTETEETMKKNSSQITEKHQILTFYEQQKQKMILQIKEMRRVIKQTQQQAASDRQALQVKESQFENMQLQIQAAKRQVSIKEKQLRQQWEQQIKTYEFKLQQKQQLLQEQQIFRKQAKSELEETQRKLKEILIVNQQKVKQLNRQLANALADKDRIQKDIINLKETVSSQQKLGRREISELVTHKDQLLKKIEHYLKEIKRIGIQLQESQREKSLQATLITQLQTKINQMQMSLKGLQSRKSEQKSAKKELTAIKNNMLSEIKLKRAVQEQLSDYKDENTRLKGMIRQMKKQLQEVYVQFNRVKVIEQERQQLLSEVAKSDRMKEQLNRDYEVICAQNVKLSQLNKGLALEVKHYKSALERIDILR